jgi:hypothetical protein
MHVHIRLAPGTGDRPVNTPGLRLTEWDLAVALAAHVQSWLGKELVFVGSSFFDGYDRLGQLMANYTGNFSPAAVAASRDVLRLGDELVVASLALHRGTDGRLRLAPAMTAGGSWTAYRPRRGGTEPLPGQSRGRALGAGRPIPDPPPGRLLAVYPAIQRRTPGAPTLTWDPAGLSQGALALLQAAERTRAGLSFYGNPPQLLDRRAVEQNRWAPPASRRVAAGESARQGDPLLRRGSPLQPSGLGAGDRQRPGPRWRAGLARPGGDVRRL